MDNEFLQNAQDLFVLLKPKKGHLVDKEISTMSSLGYIRLRNKDKKILFTINKKDLFGRLEQELSKRSKEMVQGA